MSGKLLVVSSSSTLRSAQDLGQDKSRQIRSVLFRSDLEDRVTMGQSQSSKGTGHSNYSHKPKHPSSSSSHPSFSSSSSSSSHKKHSPKTSHQPRAQPRPEARAHDWNWERGNSYGYSREYERERRLPEPSRSTTVVSSYSGGHTERSVPTRQFSLTKQTPSSSPPKTSQIEKYFNQYKDEVEDAILAEGMENFCIDLGVDPTEFVVLLVAWKFEASQMCRFTREEFLNGCQRLRAYDAKSLKERLPELVLEVRRPKLFKELYNFTFTFGLDHATAQRSLPIDMAIPLWELVFSQDKPAVVDRWFAFLKATDVRGISRDTWNMFLPFCNTIRSDLSNYDESEAWPSLFDDFVEYEMERS